MPDTFTPDQFGKAPTVPAHGFHEADPIHPLWVELTTSLAAIEDCEGEPSENMQGRLLPSE